MIIILAVGLLYLLTFFVGSYFALFFNILFSVIIAIFLKRDINKRGMLKYYLLSTIVVVIMLVFNDGVFKGIFDIFKKVNIIEFTASLILIYILGYAIEFISEEYRLYSAKTKKEMKKRRS